MKTKSMVLATLAFVLVLTIAAHADNIGVIDVELNPTPFPGYSGPFPNMVFSPSELDGFFIRETLVITNLTNQVIYLSGISSPDFAGSHCIPDTIHELNLCNAAGELSLAGFG